MTEICALKMYSDESSEITNERMFCNTVRINEQSRIILRYPSLNINYASSSKSKTILPKQSTNSIQLSKRSFN
jgi:hypothetical protein